MEEDALLEAEVRSFARVDPINDQLSFAKATVYASSLANSDSQSTYISFSELASAYDLSLPDSKLLLIH